MREFLRGILDRIKGQEADVGSWQARPPVDSADLSRPTMVLKPDRASTMMMGFDELNSRVNGQRLEFRYGDHAEKLSIDDKKDGTLIGAYAELLRTQQSRIGSEGGRMNTGVMEAVMKIINESIPDNPAKVTQMVQSQEEFGTPILLGSYIGEGGLPRHRALLGGYLLEKFKSDGHIRGDVRVETGKAGANARILYRNSRGMEFEFDCAEKVLKQVENGDEV